MPKMLNFLWRATTDCILTKFKFKQRHIVEEDTCLFCNQASESTLHVLCYCDFARNMWHYSSLGWTADNNENVKDWLALFMKDVVQERWRLIAAVCWSV